eukprot:CAMPEP_0168565314 /NCGR_PEP_ID=MMETSP0413-20121227/13767_1 /TAXON_ID=136452 /ORGANISM="Filamoeba nolandi, Strain NC-AS-23-1" /LENGTH=747 /DNA_ID=CAMNT_0008597153 /DNA_START=100 /DNA_END=2343 /DNA_ORIENTATION=-
MTFGVNWTITQNVSPIVEGLNGTTTDWTFTITRDDTTLDTQIGVSTVSSGVYNSANIVTDIAALVNASLPFGAGTASAMINVTVKGDAIYEFNETFIITLFVDPADTFTNFTVTIPNDDPMPVVTALGQGFEGTATNTNATVAFQMNRPSELLCFANWKTASGTALIGVDFVAKSGTQVFPPGGLLSPNVITIIADSIAELTEGLLLVPNGLSGNCTFAGGQVAILDDGDPVVAVISAVSTTATVFEGSSAATAATLQWPLSLSPVSAGQPVNVTYSIIGGTATPGTDYAPPVGGMITIPAGASVANFWVKVVPDLYWETNETIAINITGTSGATWSGSTMLTGTIVNDDPVPSLYVIDASFAEGNSSPNNKGVIVSTGAGWPQQPITVEYTLLDGTATAGSDYINVTNTFVINATTSGVGAAIVPIIGDTVHETANKTFYVTITSVSCPACTLYTVGITRGTGAVTILDDDSPILFVSGNTVTEAYGAVLTFTISVQTNQTADIVVNWSTTGGTATNDVDFTVVSGTATIAAGAYFTTVTVPILNDTVSEPTETVIFTVDSIVSGPATLGSAGTGFILDNPSTPLPVIYLHNITVPEGNSGNTTGYVPLTLSPASERVVNVTYSTRDESAYSPVDYYTVDGWVAFFPGETAKNITVTIVADTIEEPQTAFVVRLNSVSNAAFGNFTAGVIISDDDALITAAVQSDVYEGSPAFNPRFIGLIVVIGVVVIAIIASIVGFFALKRYVS